jgi:hypothetical protein
MGRRLPTSTATLLWGLVVVLVGSVVVVEGAAASSRLQGGRAGGGRPSLHLSSRREEGRQTAAAAAAGTGSLRLAPLIERQQQQEEGQDPSTAHVAPHILGRQRPRPPSSPSSSWLSAVRGGVTKATTKSKVTPKAAASAGATNKIRFAQEQTFKQKAKAWYRSTPTITRLHLTLALVLTALGTLVVDPYYFLLDPVATVAGLQLWRPFTAAAFLGPPSMSWASNIYFLHQYGACVFVFFFWGGGGGCGIVGGGCLFPLVDGGTEIGRSIFAVQHRSSTTPHIPPLKHTPYHDHHQARRWSRARGRRSSSSSCSSTSPSSPCWAPYWASL